MVDLDDIARSLKSMEDGSTINQARVSVMSQNEEGFVTEFVINIKYDDGDYQWSVSSNPITR